MRVVCLVPSWTESLVEAGVNVVGRTRFCIHPAQKVQNIPIVGGTKDIKWDIISELNPDLLLFDQEENPKYFSEQCPFPWLATHVVDLESCAREMGILGKTFQNKILQKWSAELSELIREAAPSWNFAEIPGEIQKIHFESAPSSSTRNAVDLSKVIYLIWQKPWMAVSQQTYIWSVLKFLGAPLLMLNGLESDDSNSIKYPELVFEILQEHYLLFSSEPYPFEKKINEIQKLSLRGSLVDGEKYSWFGVRGLRFLQQEKQRQMQRQIQG